MSYFVDLTCSMLRLGGQTNTQSVGMHPVNAKIGGCFFLIAPTIAPLHSPSTRLCRTKAAGRQGKLTVPDCRPNPRPRA